MRAPGIPESPARVEFTVQFSHGPKGRRRVREASGQPDPTPATDSAAARPKAAFAKGVPKITRLLVLGHHFERLVREGAVKDYAEIARLTGLTRARVTQIVNLTLLAPEVQEDILNLSNVTRGPDPVTERALRAAAAHADWRTQNRAWVPLRQRLGSQPAA